jgi:uncharacterized membrane protein YjjB (DUF3815 family)
MFALSLCYCTLFLTYLNNIVIVVLLDCALDIVFDILLSSCLYATRVGATGYKGYYGFKSCGENKYIKQYTELTQEKHKRSTT